MGAKIPMNRKVPGKHLLSMLSLCLSDSQVKKHFTQVKQGFCSTDLPQINFLVKLTVVRRYKL